jgi:hypothetical protein
MLRPEDLERAWRELEARGLIRRWWCERCDDKVPYRCLEMSEEQSRRKHDAARHPSPRRT